MGRKKGDGIATEGLGPAWPDLLMTPSPQKVKASEPLFLHSPPNVSPTYFISLLGRLKEDLLGMWANTLNVIIRIKFLWSKTSYYFYGLYHYIGTS